MGEQVTAANFTVNMAGLKPDKSLRDTVLKNTNAIETNGIRQPFALATLSPARHRPGEVFDQSPWNAPVLQDL